MNISENDTLPDDAWKDSFDKLLDQRPILRELKIIKRDVRASFNMNSSYENSGCNNSSSIKVSCENQTRNQNVLPNRFSVSPIPTKAKYLEVPRNIKDKKENYKQSKTVSTPIKRYSTANPFKCTLSPIGTWDLQHFNNKVRKGNGNEKVDRIGLNATPVNNNIVVNVEYFSDKNVSMAAKETEPHSFGISPLAIVKEKWKSKQRKKNVCFADKNLNESTKENDSLKEANTLQIYPKLDLHPGKWRRSVNYFRRTQTCLTEKDINPETPKKQTRKGRSSIIERSKSLAISVAGNRKSICIRPSSIESRSFRSTYSLECNDFKRQILKRCGQSRILKFDFAYKEDFLKNCCKIGEGAFGEVFGYTNLKTKQKTVLKIIPIEGKQLINGEVQKIYEQILPEIIISMELSGLSQDNNRQNKTSGFVNLQRVRCVKGQYPAYLQKLWEEYDLKKESENDHPKCFTSNQQYIVLELAFGGQDMEGFCFKSAEQSFAALKQIILTLAVGEREFQFEHRDLHWGNVLVLNTNQQNVSYKLDGEILTIPTQGIIITIIDYTLSRMTLNDFCFFNDLSNDEELFSAIGDYQFEIYRMMRNVVNDKWETFEPKTNIFWISYIISKFVEGVKYKSTRSKNHLNALKKLKQLQKTALTYKSCADFAKDVILY